MGTKTRTEIIVEKHQRIVIRSRRQTVIAWCEQCSVETLMLSPEKAAALVHTTVRDLCRRVEAGELHFIETESGALLVCSNSLSSEFSTRQKRKAAGES
jgi:SRSO17 transposase